MLCGAAALFNGAVHGLGCRLGFEARGPGASERACSC